MKLSKNELGLMQNLIGEDLNRNSLKNYCCTPKEDKVWESLVKKGLVNKTIREKEMGGVIYQISDAGFDELIKLEESNNAK